MKTRKKILPDWIVKRIEFKQENEWISSRVVGIVALYLVGVMALFVFRPFGGENLWMEIIFTICSFVTIAAASMVFVAQVALLERTRIKAMEAYKRALAKEKKAKAEEKKAKTEEEKAKAVEKEAEAQKEQAMWAETLETLHVKLKKAA